MRYLYRIWMWLWGRKPTTQDNHIGAYRTPSYLDPSEPEKEPEPIEPVKVRDPIWPKIKEFFVKHYWDVIWTIVVFSVLGCTGWFLHRLITAPPDPPDYTSHCYIEHVKVDCRDDAQDAKYYRLVGYRTRETNIKIGEFETLEKAHEAAKLIECPIK